MAGKKDKSVVAVISGLTDSQAARISADIMKSKQRNAPNGRGTVASGFTSSVGSLLQKGTKRIGGVKQWQRTDHRHIRKRREPVGREMGTDTRFVVLGIMWRDIIS